MPNAGLQLRRAISIQAEGKKLLEKHAIAPSAARLCWARAQTLAALMDNTASGSYVLTLIWQSADNNRRREGFASLVLHRNQDCIRALTGQDPTR